MSLKVVFMGTPELAAASLAALLRSPDVQVIAVVTQPDQPKGRGLKLQPPPVKELALRENLRVLQPERARDESHVQELRALLPDLIVVAAYGQILPTSILNIPRHGCLNVHTSLLPKYRGAAPIQRAMLDGAKSTGVTIMKMDAGLDTGPILATAETPVHDSDNAQILLNRLGSMGAELLVQTIPGYVAGRIHPRPQPTEGVSYAPKIKKQEGRIDWTQPAQAVWNRVRALVPWPGAFTMVAGEQRDHLLKIWIAEVCDRSGKPGTVLSADKTGIVVGCGEGSLAILVVQPEGKRQMTAAEFIAGHSAELSKGFR